MNIFICETNYHLTIAMLLSEVRDNNYLILNIDRNANKIFAEKYQMELSHYFNNITYLPFMNSTSGKYPFKNSIKVLLILRNINRQLKLILSKIDYKNEKLKVYIFTNNLFERSIVNRLRNLLNVDFVLVEDGLGSYISLENIFSRDYKFIVPYKKIDLKHYLLRFLRLSIRLGDFDKYLYLEPSLLSQHISGILGNKLEKISFNNNLTLIFDKEADVSLRLSYDKENIYFSGFDTELELSFFNNHLKKFPVKFRYHPSNNLSFEIHNNNELLPWELNLIIKKQNNLIFTLFSSVSYTHLYLSRTNDISVMVYNCMKEIDVPQEVLVFFNKLKLLFPDRVKIPYSVEELVSYCEEKLICSKYTS